MKKVLISILIVLSIISTFFYNFNNNTNSKNIQESISDKIIRFHVIANSDTESDQNLKVEIKDKIIEYIQPKLINSKDIKMSKNILINNDKEIKKIAYKVINDEGYNYDVVTSFSKENFPIKTYGSITLPQGEYNAYRVIIGNGEGHNWWCVMFPPLCFVDITKGQIACDETETIMKKVLTDDEYEEIDNTIDNKVVLKFKLLEEFKKILNKFS